MSEHKNMRRYIGQLYCLYIVIIDNLLMFMFEMPWQWQNNSNIVRGLPPTQCLSLSVRMCIHI